MASSQDRTVLRPDGWVTASDVDGVSREADTLQCCHCARHWVVVQGSGRVRGYCTKCNHPTCGRGGCNECDPWKKRYESSLPHV